MAHTPIALLSGHPVDMISLKLVVLYIARQRVHYQIL
jgi:hypothetical protein